MQSNKYKINERGSHMIKFLNKQLFFGMIFGLCQCYAAEQPKCVIGDKETNLIKLNEMYYHANHRFMEDRCLDPKGEFPVDAITYKEGCAPHDDPGQFILNLFEACRISDYQRNYANHAPKLPTLQVTNERLTHHIFFVLLVQTGFVYNEPLDPIDDRGNGTRYNAHFLWIDREIGERTKKPKEARIALWSSIGFEPLLDENDLQLPIKGKPSTTGKSDEKCCLQ